MPSLIVESDSYALQNCKAIDANILTRKKDGAICYIRDDHSSILSEHYDDIRF